MSKYNIVPVHPGEMLLEEYLRPLDISISDFAKHIGISRVRLSEIVNGRRGISADTALRLSKAIGTTAEIWINMQAHWDLAEAQKAAKKALAKIKPIARKAA